MKFAYVVLFEYDSDYIWTCDKLSMKGIKILAWRMKEFNFATAESPGETRGRVIACSAKEPKRKQNK